MCRKQALVFCGKHLIVYYVHVKHRLLYITHKKLLNACPFQYHLIYLIINEVEYSIFDEQMILQLIFKTNNSTLNNMNGALFLAVPYRELF